MAKMPAPRKTVSRRGAPRKSSASRTPQKAAARKASAERSGGQAAARRARPVMTAQHKQALAAGREQSRAVRRYLEALDAHKPRRGRKRTVSSIESRLRQIDARLADADPLTRVHLAQERLDLEAELASKQDTVDLKALEDGFIKSARAYGARKNLSYSAWRSAGVDAGVLRRAGIPRSRA